MDMVTSVTSLGRNGLYDWLVQRISAVVLLLWFLYIAYFVASHSNLGYGEWRALFAATWMRIFTLSALFALCAHAWIGMWTISTDYFTTALLGRKAIVVRLLFQIATMAVLVVYLLWCVLILWSV
jgi:succinate dehydrogenase / fumarate reductase membrane anchor subunit